MAGNHEMPILMSIDVDWAVAQQERIGAAKDQDLFHHPICTIPGLASWRDLRMWNQTHPLQKYVLKNITMHFRYVYRWDSCDDKE